MTNVPQQAPAGSVLHPPSRYGAQLRHDADTLQRDSDSHSMGQASWLQDALPKRGRGWVTITMWMACHYHVSTNPQLKSFILPLFPTLWIIASCSSLPDPTFNNFGLKQHLRLTCSSIQLLADTLPLWSASLQHSGIQPIGAQGYLHIFKHHPTCSG